MLTRHFAKLAALSVLIAGACLPVQAGPPKDPLAVFTQKDPGFTEIITLYADGGYEQSETQLAKELYHVGSLHVPIVALPRVDLIDRKRNTWRLLDKEGGVPLLYKSGENFPIGAVVELKKAMPFGLVWDNQSPFGMHGDRNLEADLFQVTKPAARPVHSGTIITLGSPLPPLVRP